MKTVRIPASRAERDQTAGPWGSLRWMANLPLSGSSVSVARLIIAKGQSGELHRHANADEVLYLFRGKVCVHGEEEETVLDPGDALTIPAGMTHRIENIGSEDSEMTLSYSSGSRAYEAQR